MNESVIRAILRLQTERAGITYGVATGPNTVAVAGSAVAVTLPALTPVDIGDYVAVLEQGADRLIIGPVGAGGKLPLVGGALSGNLSVGGDLDMTSGAISNVTTIVTSGDVTVGDDLTVADDLAVTGDITGGALARFTRDGFGATYGDATLLVGSGGAATAQLAMWVSGIAHQFRFVNDGTVHHRNFNDSGYYQFWSDVVDTSSAHLKQDIEDWHPGRRPLSSAVVDTESALELIKRVQVKKYRWKKEARLARTPDAPCPTYRRWEQGQIGVVAQQLGEVIPEAAVLAESGEYEGVKTLALVSVLIKAVQELTAEVEQLRQRERPQSQPMRGDQ